MAAESSIAFAGSPADSKVGRQEKGVSALQCSPDCSPVAIPEPEYRAPRAVEALSPTDMWMVGDNYTGTMARPLILHWNGTPSGQTFEDVPTGNTFYTETEQLYTLAAIGGYSCVNPEPCVPPQNRPYFRPGSNVTRGQTSKIVATAFYPDCPILAAATPSK